MSKIGLVLTREYTTRVKKKSFIIMTILMPALMAAMFIPVSYTHLTLPTNREV